MTVVELIRSATTRLVGAEARFEAELLLMHALNCDRAWLFAHPDAIPDPEIEGRFLELVERRTGGVPVAYLIGMRGFWTLDLVVTPAVLIPRPETELLVEVALECLCDIETPDVLDLGTGSGAIALALATERINARIVATDASADALVVAAENARRHALDKVAFLHGSWYAPVAGRRFHLIVSNPPYIAEGDAHLDRGDLRHEPRHALTSGVDGLDALREIAGGAVRHLDTCGWLVVEHGATQGPAVRTLLAETGLNRIESRCDIEGRERITLGQR